MALSAAGRRTSEIPIVSPPRAQSIGTVSVAHSTFSPHSCQFSVDLACACGETSSVAAAIVDIKAAVRRYRMNSPNLCVRLSGQADQQTRLARLRDGPEVISGD